MCESAWNKGSDAHSMYRHRRAKEAGFEEVELASPEHLTLDELKPRDLPFGRSI